MTRHSLLLGLTLASLEACGQVSTLGSGMDAGGTGAKATGGASGNGGTTSASAGLASTLAGAPASSSGATSVAGAAASGGAESTVSMLGGAGGGATTGGATSTAGGASTGGAGGTTSTAGAGGTAGSGLGGRSSAQDNGGRDLPLGDGGDPGSNMEPTGGASGAGCEVNTLDTTQGNGPAPADQCAAIGAAAKQAHDAALTGAVLEVTPMAGSWADGTGSARIEVVLDGTGAGTIRFGEASDLPAITDPSAAYLSMIGPNDASQVFGFAYLEEQPGFAYSVIAESGRGSQMSFHIQDMQAWDTWCGLQPSVSSPNSLYCYACTYDAGLYSFYTGCGDDTGCFSGDHDASESNRVDCGRIALCVMPYDSVCACDADSCFANVQVQDQLSVHSFTATIDPVDTTVLRLTDTDISQEMQVTYYLGKED